MLDAENDSKHLLEITNFLRSKNIEYTNDEPTVFHLNDGKLQLRYINSWNNKMDYSNRFGIKGIPHKTFMNITKNNLKNDIRTIYIKDFEIYEKNTVPLKDGTSLENYQRKFEVIKSYICGATNNIGTRVYARDTEIRLVPNDELRPFLNTNCFYGYRSSNINLGLYAKKDKDDVKKDDLIMVYTFGHPFYGKSRWDVEIIRVATKLHHQVIGGASKLLDHFLANYDCLTIGGRQVETNRIVYYVDADHNTGKSLNTLGFDFVEHNGPGFINMWAVDCEYGKQGETFMRKPSIHKTIMKYMAEGKVFSVPNAGTIIYVLDRNIYKNGQYALQKSD